METTRVQKIKSYIFLLFTVSLFCTSAFPQAKFKSKITGTVVDAETRTPLLNVNIFLANTTIGAASGEDGSFLIEFVPPGIYDMVVSMIGYEVKTKQIQIAQAQSYNFIFTLKPKPIKGDEIAVEAPNPKQWKKDLKKFENLFLGESENAKKCSILNPYVLSFAIDPVSRKFVTFSDSTLRVENRSLGYLLKIVFQKFNYSRIRLVYDLFIQFEELKTKDEKTKTTWVNNRLKTYRGSFRHFLKSLVKRNLKKEGFELYEATSLQQRKAWEPIRSYETELLATDSTNFVTRFRFRNYLGIIYTGKNDSFFIPKKAILSRESSFAELDSLGNLFSGYDLVKHWDWANERIADILPFDYKPNE
jgi:hypothetical protein